MKQFDYTICPELLDVSHSDIYLPCSKCKKELPDEYFRKDPNRKSRRGRQYICISCINEKKAPWEDVASFQSIIKELEEEYPEQFECYFSKKWLAAALDYRRMLSEKERDKRLTYNTLYPPNEIEVAPSRWPFIEEGVSYNADTMNNNKNNITSGGSSNLYIKCPKKPLTMKKNTNKMKKNTNKIDIHTKYIAKGIPSTNYKRPFPQHQIQSGRGSIRGYQWHERRTAVPFPKAGEWGIYPGQFGLAVLDIDSVNGKPLCDLSMNEQVAFYAFIKTLPNEGLLYQTRRGIHIYFYTDYKRSRLQVKKIWKYIDNELELKYDILINHYARCYRYNPMEMRALLNALSFGELPEELIC